MPTRKGASEEAKAALPDSASARGRSEKGEPTLAQVKRADELRKRTTFTSGQRALRDALVVEMRAQRVPFSRIAGLDGRSERQLKRVVQKWEADGPLPSILDETPMEIVEGLLRRARFAWGLFAEIALEADSDNARVGALKGMLQADERVKELTEAVGAMPRDLHLFRGEDQLMRMGNAMIDKVEAVERGEITIGELGEFFRDMLLKPGDMPERKLLGAGDG